MDIGEEIRRVLDIEIEGLEAVRSNINENFVRAVELIASSNGHVYVTGTGKSGIIATKIAATLRSTGTPATFLHPSEALHGDIGVVNRNDIVLSIGKSGETSELNELLRIVKKIGATIIAFFAMACGWSSRLQPISRLLAMQRPARKPLPRLKLRSLTSS